MKKIPRHVQYSREQTAERRADNGADPPDAREVALDLPRSAGA